MNDFHSMHCTDTETEMNTPIKIEKRKTKMELFKKEKKKPARTKSGVFFKEKKSILRVVQYRIATILVGVFFSLLLFHVIMLYKRTIYIIPKKNALIKYGMYHSLLVHECVYFYFFSLSLNSSSVFHNVAAGDAAFFAVSWSKKKQLRVHLCIWFLAFLLCSHFECTHQSHHTMNEHDETRKRERSQKVSHLFWILTNKSPVSLWRLTFTFQSSGPHITITPYKFRFNVKRKRCVLAQLIMRIEWPLSLHRPMLSSFIHLKKRLKNSKHQQMVFYALNCFRFTGPLSCRLHTCITPKLFTNKNKMNCERYTHTQLSIGNLVAQLFCFSPIICRYLFRSARLFEFQIYSGKHTFYCKYL